MKKKLLITNCGFSEIPLIMAAKRLGFYVISVGNNPLSFGRKYVDEYHAIDFSNIKDTLEIARHLKIDAVCSSANDFGILTASYIAEKMCLGGHDPYETTVMLHHKHKFKELIKHCNIHTVPAYNYDSVATAMHDVNKFEFPVIIKPIDLTGGKGVAVVQSKMELEAMLLRAFSVSKSKKIIIESFFSGTQHSMTAFLLNKKIVFTYSDNEYSYLNPFLVSTSAGPALGFENVKQRLIEDSEKLAEYLNLVDGVFHIQYLQNGNDFSIIEITRRCSGDLYPYPVNHAAGITWEDWIVKAETGMDCSDFPAVQQKGFCGRHCLMASKNGILDDVVISPEIKGNIFDELTWWNKDDVVSDYMQQKFGIYMLQYGSEAEMLEKTKRITDLFKVNVS
ncbi:MAG: hypothetical protein FWC26_14880 [Fibromonadales bacterium]|nr:hypothetical protein [Fibromonadales bacterium]